MILCARDGAVVTLTLNRPDKANAVTPDMLADLVDHVERLGDAKVLILTGAGRVFSAGADLDAVRAGLATSELWETLSGAIARFDGLSICALNGSLAGGAFGMALACDIRVAVPGAKFFYPVMKLGFLPQPSDPGRLTALIGPARAKMVLMGGARLDAAQALQFGLVDALDDDVIGAAHRLAGDVLLADRAHVAAIKQMI
ncbi:enoyl-CoA hydratase/isomerase family protein [Oceaniglobus ichthyenteri]|uniref:enoyl-CoA hydratase/isomerase family protein n=1 Tax=Oceaniglobus ichthyenteri TaxID=2136177 RepID=UPI000D3B18DD|nr:enoyl-CoA hydratase/isomerase family protein [Oceaniglobus ichthyenteri]